MWFARAPNIAVGVAVSYGPYAFRPRAHPPPTPGHSSSSHLQRQHPATVPPTPRSRPAPPKVVGTPPGPVRTCRVTVPPALRSRRPGSVGGQGPAMQAHLTSSLAAGHGPVAQCRNASVAPAPAALAAPRRLFTKAAGRGTAPSGSEAGTEGSAKRRSGGGRGGDASRAGQGRGRGGRGGRNAGRSSADRRPPGAERSGPTGTRQSTEQQGTGSASGRRGLPAVAAPPEDAGEDGEGEEGSLDLDALLADTNSVSSLRASLLASLSAQHEAAMAEERVRMCCDRHSHLSRRPLIKPGRSCSALPAVARPGGKKWVSMACV
jgi:hypothetical protein